MTKETAKSLATILMVSGVLCFVFSCGSCYSCVVTKRQPISQEQDYVSEGHLIHKDADYDISGENYGYYVFIPLGLGIVMFSVGSVFLSLFANKYAEADLGEES